MLELRNRLLRTPLGWVLSIFAAALGAYLLFTHTGHVLGAIPFLILLACPLMHLFGHHHGHRDSARKPKARDAP